MTAVAFRDELRGPVFTAIAGQAAEAAQASGFAVAAPATLPECTCFLDDCARDHDNE